MSTRFNPHDNTTDRGARINLGMTVLDYDRRTGIVVGDSYETMHEHGACGNDHWFLVQYEKDGPTKTFNGTRLDFVEAPPRCYCSMLQGVPCGVCRDGVLAHVKWPEA